MPSREHANTCESVLSALENIRDMDEAALRDQSPAIREHHDTLAGWKRGQELDHATVLETARSWAVLFVMDGLVECNCDAKYVYVIARRWHRGHFTTAPAKVIARIAKDAYVVEFLTDGPGEKRQGSFRVALGVALDDTAYLGQMEIGPLVS